MDREFFKNRLIENPDSKTDLKSIFPHAISEEMVDAAQLEGSQTENEKTEQG